MRAHFEKHHKEKALEWFEQQAGMGGEGDMEEMMQVRSFRRGALDSIRLQHAGVKDLPVYGDGKQTRCFSYIDDCLSCLIPMLDQKNLNKQTINIGPDEEFVTINKIAEICSNLTGVNLEPIHKKDRPKEVKHATCSADKARSLLDYKTTVSLQDGIKKTYEYIKKRGTRPFDYNIDIEIDNELTPSTWKNKEI